MYNVKENTSLNDRIVSVKCVIQSVLKKEKFKKRENRYK